jgi:nucleoredoxin
LSNLASQVDFAMPLTRLVSCSKTSVRLSITVACLLQPLCALAAIPPATASASPIVALLSGKLVASQNGVVSDVADQTIGRKKLIALYFAASWCPHCRKFTPKLIDYYNRVAAEHPEFEIVFVSKDRSRSAMEAHMRDSRMPWPAVKYESLSTDKRLLSYAGSGIPCLVVIDRDGRVVSDTYDRKKYRGPSVVLADLDVIFARSKTALVN